MNLRLLATTLSLSAAALAQPAAAPDATLVIDTTRAGPVINRNIYGHFAEHLGRCIYEGIWVGEDSPIPNTRGDHAAPETVKPQPFTDARLEGARLAVTLPARSVVILELRAGSTPSTLLRPLAGLHAVPWHSQRAGGPSSGEAASLG